MFMVDTKKNHSRFQRRCLETNSCRGHRAAPKKKPGQGLNLPMRPWRSGPNALCWIKAPIYYML